MSNREVNEKDQVQALLDAISAGDDEAAERSAHACAGQARWLPALRPLLSDANPDRRWWAVRTLALIDGAEAEELLLRHLTDPDEATRCAAALALGQLRVADAVPALIARLADDSGWVRDSAADALAMIGDPALSALVQALADARGGVRVRAAGALRKAIVPALSGLTTMQFDPRYWPAIAALFQALNDPNRLVRHNAYEALDRLGLLEVVVVPS